MLISKIGWSPVEFERSKDSVEVQDFKERGLRHGHKNEGRVKGGVERKMSLSLGHKYASIIFFYLTMSVFPSITISVTRQVCSHDVMFTRGCPFYTCTILSSILYLNKYSPRLPNLILQFQNFPICFFTGSTHVLIAKVVQTSLYSGYHSFK